MGTLTCQRCGATAEGSSQKEADDRIDHSRGQMIGRPCAGNTGDLKWSEIHKKDPDAPKATPTLQTTDSSKSSTKIRKSKRG